MASYNWRCADFLAPFHLIYTYNNDVVMMQEPNDPATKFNE